VAYEDQPNWWISAVNEIKRARGEASKWRNK